MSFFISAKPIAFLTIAKHGHFKQVWDVETAQRQSTSRYRQDCKTAALVAGRCRFVEIQEITMLDNILARYRVWQFKLTTINRLRDLSDRQLADMGIERVNIAAIAARNAKADKRLQRPATIHRAIKPDNCGVTIQT
jgi:uncharacterized protein YjiS (DUF1127 family)